MRDFEYYKTIDLPYPDRRDYTKFHYYKNGKLRMTLTAKEAQAADDKDLSSFVRERIFDAEGYSKDKAAYGAEEGRLHQEFRQDIADEFGVADNPKFDKCFAKAWEDGHSAGYYEVYNVFSELVELIK